MMLHLQNKNIKKIGKLFFLFLTISSLIFLSYRMYKNWELIKVSLGSNPILPILLLASFGYFLITALLPKSWQSLLSLLTGKNISYINAYIIYGQTQIAKYLPGNVFHFVSRQVNADRLGVNQGSTLISSFIETVSYLLVAVIISLLLHALGFEFGVEIINKLILVFSIILVLTILFVVFFPGLNKILRNNTAFKKFTSEVTSTPTEIRRKLPYYFFILFVFFLLTSLLFALFIYRFDHSGSNVSLFSLFPIFCLSYAIGLVTPGAPAGLGVREAIMVVTLTPLIGNANATLLAVLFRMVTVIGDVLFFISATILNKLCQMHDLP